MTRKARRRVRGRRDGGEEPTPALHCGLSDCYQCCCAAFVGTTGREAEKGRDSDRITTEKKKERKAKRGGS